jgi:hypothetical protein
MRALVLVVLPLLLEARPAEACSCASEPPVTSPANGAAGVPRNANILVRDAAGTVELREAETDAVVAMTATRRGSTYVGVPDAPLAANTTYRLTLEGTFGTSSTTTFSTSDAMDLEPPAFAGLTSLSPETMTYPISSCYNSCVEAGGGHISRLHLALSDIPADAVLLTLQLSQAGVTGWREITLDRERPDYLGFTTCESRAPVLDPEGEYCARVIAYDIAGNRAGDDVEVCTATKRCAPKGFEGADNDCTPSTACESEGGCQATRSPSWLALAGLALLRRRRRGNATLANRRA